jgi:hypothetical protein
MITYKTNEHNNSTITILSIKDLKILKIINTFEHRFNFIMNTGKYILLSSKKILLILEHIDNYKVVFT